MKGCPSYPFNAVDGLCADAAHAAALCTSVICGLQCGLTKAVPCAAAAEHASNTRIECGGWASLLAEDSRPLLRLRDTWRPGPRPGGMLVLRAWEVRTDAGRSRTPMGGPSPRLLARSFPSSGTRGVTGPLPERGAGPGPLAW